MHRRSAAEQYREKKSRPATRFTATPAGVDFRHEHRTAAAGRLTMVSLTEKTAIPLPADEVWPLLRDPALVASCIPGATLAPDQGDGLWRGSIRVKFGPTVAVFRGEAALTFDDAARQCTIEGRGIDGRGASRALASGTVKVAGGDATELAIDGNFTVSGPLETFANAGGVHVARALLADFSANIARVVAERRPAAATAPAAATPAPAPTPRPPAAEISGGRLLWRAFLSWFRGLWADKETPR
jgi:carbon monoxide dehydrogenase subunit G